MKKLSVLVLALLMLFLRGAMSACTDPLEKRLRK